MSLMDGLNIHEHMEVLGACGNRLGTVDRIEGGLIKLSTSDFADGKHHAVPMEWVDRVGKSVYLTKNYREVKRRWEPALQEAGV